ncbi:pyruvate carboxylase [Eubacterium maltosivorans]|uniref:pyruvate carboxylase n=1 Tax=Eubacterium maltosivorans TaxID=2041044 RepID=UPI000890532B|nr:pyruvate carboxylase [Eubacterium maltosivorans]WPK81599.1 Pyruvate carboxylase [Eubacterium maltosivorans]SDP53835.1 pyruvate carboxylase [Eubacterium maltosivorans]
MKKFNKVLIANRGEIAIRIIRACQELGIQTVAIYAQEDKMSLFRSKADEAYLITGTTGPVEAYLNMDKIISLAKKKEVDAIHPGYGFLSENPEFARRCEEEGIAFIGPTHTMMEQMGDKIQSKIVAKSVNVPTIPGVEKPITSDKEAAEFAKVAGYPIMLKAAAGGGGRGMRIVRDERDLLKEYHSAMSEATKAFGDGTIFVEKYLEEPKHIEVQILGDAYGNVVHLFERDCSIQRRHQKIIEFTPSLSITEEQRQAICADALKLAKAVNYRNAGTIEFLVDKKGDHYFIEMNPRIQVEHTVTELVTGIDLVQSQIMIAEGYPLDSDEINIKGQDSIRSRGYAIQCRVTTEDPKNHFMPDTGRLDVYRTASGAGIRLDTGNGFTGGEITPYYDSLLMKSTSFSRTFEDTRRKALRALKEMQIEGVQTNKDFLINVLEHDMFKSGNCDTKFIDDHPELFNIQAEKSQAYNVIRYFGEMAVNETFGNKPDFDEPEIPEIPRDVELCGTKQILDEQGPDGLVRWIQDQNKLLLGDTTLRDAHQSLFATRVRSRDMIKIAKETAYLGRDIFALEMWGGATFDVAYNFLKESPWRRLDELRKRIPNILFQMLLRGANAVGYKNYPDNVLRKFIQESAAGGIDVFRIFDSLNWMEGMKVSIDEVLKTGKVCEVAMCYTGDILDPKKTKYDLDYYVRMAHEIEATGAHILAIKDMSALLKPAAAFKLIKTLKEEVKIPVRLHTHDTAGNGVAAILMATMAGVDIADAAFSSMSGLTSQPSLNSVVAALANTPRDTGMNEDDLQLISDYWETTRQVYSKFESGLKSGSTEIYNLEIPGGQYSNLKSQVESFGLGHKFKEVKQKYMEANLLLGDIVKVTPSSKVVGDMAIFMVQNGLDMDNIYEKGRDLAYPNSVVDYFKGMIGQPEGGFDPKLQEIVLKGIEPITVRPGTLLPDEDFEAIKEEYREEFGIELAEREVTSAALYPKVFKNYVKFYQDYGDFMRMDTHAFFYGLKEGETAEVEVDKGKRFIIRMVKMAQPNEEGYRPVLFEVDGFRREIYIEDKRSLFSKEKSTMLKADKNNPKEIGSGIPGTVLKVLVNEGDEVAENQPLIIVEAMKMETEIVAHAAGKIKEIYVSEGQSVQSGELIITME